MIPFNFNDVKRKHYGNRQTERKQYGAATFNLLITDG
jgi:hypothetical protein